MDARFEEAVSPTLSEEVARMKKFLPLLRNWQIQFPKELEDEKGIEEAGEFARNFFLDKDAVKYEVKYGMRFKGNLIREKREPGEVVETEEIAIIRREAWRPRGDLEIIKEYKPYEVTHLEDKVLCSAETKYGKKFFFFLDEVAPIAGIALQHYGCDDAVLLDMEP